MPKPTPVAGLDADTPVRRAAQRILAARLADLRGFEAGARQLEVETIHDLRVATRRLRAALQVFCGGGDSEVQALGKALGAVRDLQVELQWLDDHVLEKRERARAGKEVEARLAEAGRALGTALTRWSTRDVARVKRTFELAERARTRGRLGGGWGATVLKEGLAGLKPKLKSLRKTIRPDHVHALRKKVKRLKYEAELFQAARPGAMRKWSATLSALQEHLGDLHDADLRCAWLDNNPAASLPLRNLAHLEREKLSHRLTLEIERWHRDQQLRTLRRAL